MRKRRITSSHMFPWSVVGMPQPLSKVFATAHASQFRSQLDVVCAVAKKVAEARFVDKPFPIRARSRWFSLCHVCFPVEQQADLYPHLVFCRCACNSFVSHPFLVHTSLLAKESADEVSTFLLDSFFSPHV